MLLATLSFLSDALGGYAKYIICSAEKALLLLNGVESEANSVGKSGEVVDGKKGLLGNEVVKMNENCSTRSRDV